MFCFFFFSSRRRHTRFDCDWSSDVCSSDLTRPALIVSGMTMTARPSSSNLSGMPCSGISWISASTRTALRSEEHTSELQSQSNLVCRLLLEKKKDALNEEAQLLRQERDLVHEKKREAGAKLRELKDRRASFAGVARRHREKRDELQAKAKALIEMKRKLRGSGHSDVGAELRALRRRVSQMEMRQQTASLTLSQENELLDDLKDSMKRLKQLEVLKADQDKIAKEIEDVDSGITDLFRAADQEPEAAVGLR